jgi:hypothetical protein
MCIITTLICADMLKYTFVYVYNKPIIAKILKYIIILSCSSTLYAISLLLVFYKLQYLNCMSLMLLSKSFHNLVALYKKER